MEIVHVYQKKRREFGRQCILSDRKAKDMVNIDPSEELRQEFIYKNPNDIGIQCAQEFSEHEVNTETLEFKDNGMNHVEGGWPKDVDPTEIEQVMRFRKKVEKDEVFQETILSLGLMMESCIKQNNAIDIYEDYFPQESETAVLEPPAATMINVFRDPCNPVRSVASLSWYPDGARKLAVAYSILEFQQGPEDISMESYVWDLDKPDVPDFVLAPSSPLVSIRYNPKDVHILLGGCYNGQVAIWDTRKGSRPIETSPVEQSHRDPAHAAEYLSSKTGTEFFSCSTDGFIKWWDTRKLSEPTESLALSVNGHVLGGVALDFESTMPTRYMIGTEEGIVINGNKKAKNSSEKLSQTYGAHHGPVYTVKRNPFFQKYFLTVGDWTARIWSEDVRESPILWTKYHQCYLTCGTWSLSRPAVAFTGKADGSVDVWDYLYKQTDPVLTVQISKTAAITAIASEESGRMLACGCSDGSVTLLELSDSLVNGPKNEKPLFAAMLERETAREKVLSSRMRDLALKERVRSSKPQPPPINEDDEDPIHQAEENFWQSVDPEKWSEIREARQAQAAE